MTTKLTVKKDLKTYQCDKHGHIRPVMLMNELQAVADEHAEILNAGRTFCMANSLAWVVTHYLLDIAELPTEQEQITISTWPSVHDALKAVRDFEIRGTDGRILIRATSQWVMIDLESRRPVRLSDRLPIDWTVIPERALDLPFEKFPEFDFQTETEINIRYDDIDVNQHVNNAVYATWATESVGFEFRDGHSLCGIELNFKKEIKAGSASKVRVQSSIDNDVSRHAIMSDDITNANVICHWKKV